MLPALKALLLHMVVVRHHSPADDGYLGRGTVNNRVSLLRRFVEVQPLSYEFFYFFYFFIFYLLFILDFILWTVYYQMYNVKGQRAKVEGQRAKGKGVIIAL